MLLLASLASVGYAQDKSSMDYYESLFNGDIKVDFLRYKVDQDKFEKGSYFYYVGKMNAKMDSLGYRPPTVSWEMVIGFLLNEGIPIQEAWFRDAASSCSASNVEGPVRATLLIRFDNTLSRKLMAKYGFVQINKPDLGNCPYEINYIDFREKEEE